jgi:ferredoxin
MTRPVVDQDLCIGCGRCEETCPAVFAVGDDGFSHVISDKCAEAGCCEDAADECPVSAISLVDE